MLQPLPEQPAQRDADESSAPASKIPSSVWLPADWLETLVEAESSTPTAEVIDIHPGARWLPPEVPVQWTPPAPESVVPDSPAAQEGPVAAAPTPVAARSPAPAAAPAPAPAPPAPAVIEDVRVSDVQRQARRIALSLPTISAGGVGRYARAHRNQILVTAAAALALALPVFSGMGNGGLTGQPGATVPTPPAHASVPPAGSPPAAAPVVPHHGGGASATHAGARLHVPAVARVAATPVVHTVSSTSTPSSPAPSHGSPTPTAPKSSGGGGASSSGSGSHGSSSNSGGGSHPTGAGGGGSSTGGGGTSGSGNGGGSQSPVSSVVSTVSNAPASVSGTVSSVAKS